MTLFEWTFLALLVSVVLLLSLSQFQLGLQAWQNFRRKKKLLAFDRLISGEDDRSSEARALLSGEAVVSDELSLFLPTIPVDDRIVGQIARAIGTALPAKQLGEVIRVFEYEGGSSCIDIFLTDFVGGVDVIGQIVSEFDLPPLATLEYTGGDLPLCDEHE